MGKVEIMQALAVVSLVGGTVMQVVGAQQQAAVAAQNAKIQTENIVASNELSARQAEYNAKVAENQAEFDRAAGVSEASKLRREGRAEIARRIAAGAGSGVAGQSPLLVTESDFAKIESEISTYLAPSVKSRVAASRDEAGLLTTQAGQARANKSRTVAIGNFNQKAAKAAGNIRSASAVLGGFRSFAGSSFMNQGLNFG